MGLSAARKIGLIVSGVGVIAGIVVLYGWASRKTYQPVMPNISSEESANIIRVLRDKKIEFKVDNDGKNVLVPPEELYQLRLELASMGLPQSGVVGYEVFDKQSLGVTSFVQKINQKRALEGELTRSINTIKGIRRSRVHLAMPAKSAFVEDQKKTTASIVVDLDIGYQLSERQVYGITNLVARAVEGMDTNDVVVMDSNGKVMSKNVTDPLMAQNASQLDYTLKVENDYERRIEELLSPIVGEGKVVAKVTTDIDFSQSNETQTTLDSEGAAVLSKEQFTQSADGSRPLPGGQPGVASNVPPGQTPGPASVATGNVIKSDTKRDNSVTNYEVPKTIRRTIGSTGGIKKISVAVVLDGKTVKSTDKDGVVQSKVEPWSPEKLKEFETIISSAVGINKKRGDVLEIKNMEFTPQDFEAAERALAAQERKSYFMNLMLYLVIGIAIVLFFMFVVRPYVRWVTENTIDSVDTFLPQTIEELEKLQKNSTLPGMEEAIPVVPDNIDPDKVEGDMIREKIVTLVDSNPYKAALILEDWLHGEKKNASGDKKAGKADAPKGKSA